MPWRSSLPCFGFRKLWSDETTTVTALRSAYGEFMGPQGPATTRSTLSCQQGRDDAAALRRRHQRWLSVLTRCGQARFADDRLGAFRIHLRPTELPDLALPGLTAMLPSGSSHARGVLLPSPTPPRHPVSASRSCRLREGGQEIGLAHPGQGVNLPSGSADHVFGRDTRPWDMDLLCCNFRYL